MKVKQTQTLVTNERGDVIALESLAYIAYQKPEGWVGVCEPFPSLIASAESGSAALNAIKALVRAQRNKQMHLSD